MEVHRSALKHGIAASDASYAAEHWVYVAELDEENPAREFRLGFDGVGVVRSDFGFMLGPTTSALATHAR